MEGKEAVTLDVYAISPWLLLHQLIVHEESKLKEDPTSIPGSVKLLCSAHDLLGPKGLCTGLEGRILQLLVDVGVKSLGKVSGNESQVDYLTKHLDQVRIN